MIQDWWTAHKFEFVLCGIVWAILIPVMAIVWLKGRK